MGALRYDHSEEVMPYAKPNDEQHILFGEQESWREEWAGMPEYEQKNLLPVYSLRVNFDSVESLQAFSKLIGQSLTTKTSSVWYPVQEKAKLTDKRYVDEA